MHLIDYLITLVSVCLSLCVCLSVHRSVVERLRPQFFTDFHQILHAAQKFGCFKRYCSWDKPEVDCRFWRCAKSDFGSFATVVDIFSHGSSQKPDLRYNQSTLTLYSVVNKTGNRIRILEKCKFGFGIDFIWSRTITYAILYHFP